MSLQETQDTELRERLHWQHAFNNEIKATLPGIIPEEREKVATKIRNKHIDKIVGYIKSREATLIRETKIETFNTINKKWIDLSNSDFGEWLDEFEDELTNQQKGEQE